MKHAEIAKALTKAVEPFVRELAQDLTEIAAKAVAEQLDVAREHAIAKLREQLEGSTDVEEVDERLGDRESDRSRPSHEPERADAEHARRSAGRDRTSVEVGEAAGTAAPDPASAAPRVKKSRARMKCGHCGEEGYRSDGCGRTHNIAGSPMRDAIVKAQAPSPPPSLPPGRIGSRESRPLRAPAEARDDADEEPAAVGVIQPPTRRQRRRTRPRSQSFGRSSRGTGNGWGRFDAKLQIRAGAPIEFDLDAARPKTRGECLAGIRPCVWVGCRHHMYLDINPETGSIKLNFPELELEQLAETCVLDVADRGGITLEKTGELLNLTRERVRQIEVKAFASAGAAPIVAELRSA